MPASAEQLLTEAHPQLGDNLFSPIDLSVAAWAHVVTEDLPEDPLKDQPEAIDTSAERYARSLRLIRMLGHVALNEPDSAGADMLDSPEAQQAGYEFETSLGEMLGSHSKIGKFLKVNLETSYDTDTQGRAVIRDGQRLRAVAEAGYEKSSQEALTKPFMEGQATRDLMDVEVMKKVDALQEGQTMVVVSMYPKEMLESEHREFWMNWLSYREGHSFLQYFSKQNGRLFAGSLSASESTMEGWNDIWAQQGVEVPDDVDHNHRIGYPLIVESDSAEEARTFAESLQRQHYEALGETVPRVTVAEILEENREFIDDVKRELYVPMSTALVTGRKNDAIHNYAALILQDDNIQEIDADLRRQLMRIRNSEIFTSEDAQTMDYIIQFGTVKVLLEQVRQRFEKDKNEQSDHKPIVYVPATPEPSHRVPKSTHMRLGVLHRVAAGVGQGAADRDSFGGCGGVVKVSADRNSSGDSGGEVGTQAGHEAPPWHGGKILHGKMCNSCNKIKKEVGWCGSCQDCVKKPAQMQAAYERWKLKKLASRVTMADLLMKAA